MRMHWIAALAALTLLPATMVAQSPDERIGSALTRAESAGIPVSLLESKMAEGRAKGIPMDRIAVAVERRLEGLERAREVMGRRAEDVDAAQLSTGADALGAGVSEAVLEEIAASTAGDRRAVAVAALTQLVLQGHVPEEALLQVQNALARGPEALANLPAQAGAAGVAGAGRPAGTPGAAQGGVPSSLPTPGQPGGGLPIPPGAGPPGGGF
jgi:hypothetical protein